MRELAPGLEAVIAQDQVQEAECGAITSRVREALGETAPPPESLEAVERRQIAAMLEGEVDQGHFVGMQASALLKFLLRHGHSFTEGQKNWSMAHWKWLRKQSFEDATAQTVFTEYLLDIAREARKRAIRTVMVSCGFMNQAPLENEK